MIFRFLNMALLLPLRYVHEIFFYGDFFHLSGEHLKHNSAPLLNLPVKDPVVTSALSGSSSKPSSSPDNSLPETITRFKAYHYNTINIFYSKHIPKTHLITHSLLKLVQFYQHATDSREICQQVRCKRRADRKSPFCFLRRRGLHVDPPAVCRKQEAKRAEKAQ